MFGESIFKICSTWKVKLGILITEIVYQIMGYIMAILPLCFEIGSCCAGVAGKMLTV